MRRREFVAALGGAAAATWPLATRAQQPRKLPRMAFLGNHNPDNPNPLAAAFFRGMSELGYVDGKNVQIEYRYANAKLDLLPKLAAELVNLKPDVLVVN